MFQHTAARRRLAPTQATACTTTRFQHTAARRRLVKKINMPACNAPFQHTAARRRLGQADRAGRDRLDVSTHSRPKAAGGYSPAWSAKSSRSFNTQPPEGGWLRAPAASNRYCLFQHTAARRRLVNRTPEVGSYAPFQHTAARRRLAHLSCLDPQPCRVSTHSRPKAAGRPNKYSGSAHPCFNTQPPEGGWLGRIRRCWSGARFQHTAARRRLAVM